MQNPQCTQARKILSASAISGSASCVRVNDSSASDARPHPPAIEYAVRIETLLDPHRRAPQGRLPAGRIPVPRRATPQARGSASHVRRPHRRQPARSPRPHHRTAVAPPRPDRRPSRRTLTAAPSPRSCARLPRRGSAPPKCAIPAARHTGRWRQTARHREWPATDCASVRHRALPARQTCFTTAPSVWMRCLTEGSTPQAATPSPHGPRKIGEEARRHAVPADAPRPRHRRTNPWPPPWPSSRPRRPSPCTTSVASVSISAAS